MLASGKRGGKNKGEKKGKTIGVKPSKLRLNCLLGKTNTLLCYQDD